MKTGKVSESILKRSVIHPIEKRRTEVLAGAAVGEDCAVLEAGKGEVLVMSTNPVTGTGEEMALFLMNRIANNLASAGAESVGVMSTILLPENTQEQELKRIVKQLEEAATFLNMEIMGGHTEVTAAVREPVLSLTGVGKAGKENYKRTGDARAGQDVVLTKWIGIEGTALLAKAKEKDLRGRFSEAFVGQAQSFLKYISVVPEAAVAMKSGVSAMHDVSEGGIFNALWELAEAAGVGLDIDLKKIPVRQETIEVCEVFDINPYFLMSGGAMLMTADNGHDLVRRLELEQIPATVIGKVTDGNDRIVRNEDEVRYIEPPRPENAYYDMGAGVKSPFGA